MIRRNAIPFLYCVFFPLLIIVVLIVIPEFSFLVRDQSTSFARVVRALIAIWLMLVYIATGISLIPNLEDSSISIFRSWNPQYFNRFRNKNNEPIVTRGIFPMYFFIPDFITCVFAGFIFLLAISTFLELSILGKISIVTINVLLLFPPEFARYNKIVSALYDDLL